MSQFTASEVRAMALAVYIAASEEAANDIAPALNAFADLLEAQERAVPVAYTAQFEDGQFSGIWKDINDVVNWHTPPIALYTHPPAASVPGELAEPVAGVINYEQERSFAEGWNACRDAMLAARAKEPQS